MIILSKTLLSKIQTHAKTDYPYECCGAMLGHIEDEKKTITQIISLTNHWDDTSNETKHRRFQVSADDYQSIESKAAELGLQVCGFYHSHPDHPPIPSDTDLAYAWPFFSYPIISVEEGVPKQLKSYTLDMDTQVFVEESISIQ